MDYWVNYYTIKKINERGDRILQDSDDISEWEHFYDAYYDCDDGIVFSYEEYYKNDTLHNEDGPAIIKYENDELIEEHFYIDGIIQKVLCYIDEGIIMNTYITHTKSKSEYIPIEIVKLNPLVLTDKNLRKILI